MTAARTETLEFPRGDIFFFLPRLSSLRGSTAYLIKDETNMGAGTRQVAGGDCVRRGAGKRRVSVASGCQCIIACSARPRELRRRVEHAAKGHRRNNLSPDE